MSAPVRVLFLFPLDEKLGEEEVKCPAAMSPLGHMLLGFLVGLCLS